MVLPQFSLRMALALTAVLGVVSLIISRGLQGNPWAMGVSVSLFALVLAFLAYAAVFGIVYLISKVWVRRSRGVRPTAGGDVSAAPREPADLLPPVSELSG